MSTSISFTSTQLFQNFLPNLNSRKLLLHNPINQPPLTSAPPPNNYHNSFDGNVIMIVLVLVCAFICSLHSIIRCALKCTTLVASESTSNPSARLANKGVKQKALKTFPIVNYSVEMKLPGLDAECVICLAEFAPGEHVRLLPKCNHGFHVKCIDKWLKSHSSCPKCRDCLIETCQEIVGCSQASSSDASLPVQESIVSIVPLEPEGLIRNYKGIS